MDGVTTSAEYLARYFPVVLFSVIVAAFGGGTLLISRFVQPHEATDLSPYECGSEPVSDARMPFPVRYYIIAMLFVIFDIEVIFLYPWAVAFNKIGFLGFLEMLIFIVLFVIAFAYAWGKGALEWD